MSNENKNVSDLKKSVETVIKPEDQDLTQHDDTGIRLDSATSEISQKEVEAVPKLKAFRPKGRSFRPKPQENTSTGFIMDAPGVFGVGGDGMMMDMFNKPEFKD